MSGPRYLDWTHIRVVGSRNQAARYVPEARKLLGFVTDEAKRNNLGVCQITRKLPDGTTIIAEQHGTIPRITIVVSPRARGKVKNVRLRAFVYTPNRVVVIDLEDYQVTEADCIVTKKHYKILGDYAYGSDLTNASAGPEGSFYRANGKTNADYYMVDYEENKVTRFGVRDEVPLNAVSFTNAGDTGSLFNVVASPSRPEIYVANVFTPALLRMDAETLEITGMLALDYGVNAMDLQGMTVSPNGQTLYTVAQVGSGGPPILDVIDVETFALVATVDVSNGLDTVFTATNVACSIDGKMVYVIGWGLEDEPDVPGLTDQGSFVAAINADTLVVESYTIFTTAAYYGDAPPMKVSRDGKRLYTATPIKLSNDESGNIRVINLETMEIQHASFAAYFVRAFGLSLDNERYFTAGNMTGPELPHGNVVLNISKCSNDSLIEQLDLGIDEYVSNAVFVTIPLD